MNRREQWAGRHRGVLGSVHSMPPTGTVVSAQPNEVTSASPAVQKATWQSCSSA